MQDTDPTQPPSGISSPPPSTSSLLWVSLHNDISVLLQELRAPLSVVVVVSVGTGVIALKQMTLQVMNPGCIFVAQ